MKEELDTVQDFPMLDYNPYDNFEALFKSSKDRTYDVVMERNKNCKNLLIHLFIQEICQSG